MTIVGDRLSTSQIDNPKQPVFRLHIDEVGNSDLRSSNNPNERYLSLTGVALKLSHVQKLTEDIQQLKEEYFLPIDGRPVILHRKDILQKKPPFHTLKDTETEMNFNRQLLNLFEKFEYKVFTVVIDKLEHLKKYQTWQAHPYHYCLEVLLERYAMYLSSIYSYGDVLAESRNTNDDQKLKASFSNIYKRGTRFHPAKLFQTRLTSRDLKLKKKLANDPGLQLADLLAHPSYRDIKIGREGVIINNDFGTKIIEILNDSKYYRHTSGRIEGYGRKWLP